MVFTIPILNEEAEGKVSVHKITNGKNKNQNLKPNSLTLEFSLHSVLS